MISGWFRAEHTTKIVSGFSGQFLPGMSYYVMNTSSTSSLFDNTEPDSSHARTFINPILWFDDCAGYRVIFCRHEILYRVALDDPPHLALVAVTLRQSELATQVEIAVAFGHSVATQRRWETRYSQHGSDGLQANTPTGRPAKLGRGQQVFVERWFQLGVSNHEMARRLAVSEATIRRALRKAGLRRQTTPAAELPLNGAAPTPAEPTTTPAPAAPATSASEPAAVAPEQEVSPQATPAFAEVATMPCPEVAPPAASPLPAGNASASVRRPLRGSCAGPPGSPPGRRAVVR